MQITFTTTPEEDAIAAPAIGAILGLGRNATVQEAKAWVIAWVRSSIRDYYRQQNILTYTPPDINPQ